MWEGRDGEDVQLVDGVAGRVGTFKRTNPNVKFSFAVVGFGSKRRSEYPGTKSR